jgi:hypothetical protein
MVWRTATAALVAVALAVMAAAARGDGDPASDVLLSQSLFLPADAGVPAAQASELQRLVQAAAERGYPIRVALISGPTDLGSVTALWRQPQTYAHFLAQELALGYRGRVLVVMPGGLGLFSTGGLAPAEPSTLAGVAAPGSSAGLATAALHAVRRLAATTGHTLPVVTGGGHAGAGSTDLMAWIVFALGGIVIVAAWTMSLRARPLGVNGRDTPA